MNQEYKIAKIKVEEAQGLADCVNSTILEKNFMVAQSTIEVEQYRQWIQRHLIGTWPFLICTIQQDFSGVKTPTVVGWCEIHRDIQPLRGHNGVLSMGILKAHRGKGLGRKLLLAALEDARSKGYKRIELWVRGRNEAAKMLYHNCGFVLEGTRRGVTKLEDGTYEDEMMFSILL